MESVDRAVGLRLIVLYKAVKAAAEVLLAVAGAILLAAGLGEPLHGFILAMREHVVAAWSTRLLEVLVRETTPGRLWLGVGAVAADGLLTSVEGWALHRRYRWGPWLVVVATSSLVPFEVYELSRRMSAARVATLAVNLAIVAYLVWHARRRASQRQVAQR
ncbi:MAG TPA: DUF2127 domain-containing protein [Myxococcales bacterium]|jgi:uncharacterized membrane protein (DUF2068 family)